VWIAAWNLMPPAVMIFALQQKGAAQTTILGLSP
jgi:hypothetical protein